MAYVHAMTPKKRLVVRLTPEHRRRLEELAATANLSMSATMHLLINRSYDKFLSEQAVSGTKETSEKQEDKAPHDD
jgi:hypothetical protein